MIDEVKGMTLSEISKTVEEINASINDRKVGRASRPQAGAGLSAAR